MTEKRVILNVCHVAMNKMYAGDEVCRVVHRGGYDHIYEDGWPADVC